MSTRDAALEFIRAYLTANDGVSPTFREIMDAIGSKSLGHVASIMKALEADKKIVRLKHKNRAILVLQRDVHLPEIGPTPAAVRRHCPTGKIR